MSSIVTLDLPLAGRLRTYFWEHPEWWTRVLCGAAWALMLFHGWQDPGHELHGRAKFTTPLAYWMLMVAAMMLPLILHRVWVTAISSLWTRRHRAVAGFLGGFFAAWLPLGLIAAALLQATWTRTYAAPALAFAAAALWQRTPAYRRALMACNRTQPLAPVGWRANWDCFRFGGMIGAAYVRTCWFLMLACTFADHGPVAMAGGMAVSIVEHRSLRPALIQQATFVLAGYYGVLAVLGR